MDNTITLKPDSFISRELSLSRRPFPAVLAVLAALAIAGAIGAEEPSARPLAWKTLPPSYKASFTEYSGFSTVGRIYEVNRAASNIAVISDRPFWSPQPGVGNRVALWPAHTLLISVLKQSGGVGRKDVRTYFDLIEFDEGRLR